MSRKYQKLIWTFPFLILALLSALYYSPVQKSLEKNYGVPFSGPIYIGIIIIWLIGIFLIVQKTQNGMFLDERKPFRFHEVSIPFSYILSMAAWWIFLFSRHERNDFIIHVILCLLVSTLAFVNALPLAHFHMRMTTQIDAHISKYRSSYSNGMLALASLMLSIMIPETAFRLMITSERSRHYGYGTRFDFVLSPYLMFSEPDVKNGGSLNSQGFQGADLPYTRGTNEVRIAILGGSAAWAGGATNSIAWNLEKILKEQYPEKNIRVANFGRQSYISMQELILLQRNVLELSPDLIIVYDGFNDIWVPYNGMEPMGVGYPFLFSNLKERVEKNNVVNFRLLFSYISSRSALYNYIRSKSVKALVGKKPFEIDKCALGYRNNLYQMCVLAGAYKSKVVLSTQPYVGSKRLRSSKEESLLTGLDLKNMQVFYNEIAKVAREVAERTGTFYINTLDVFDANREEIFIDPVHVKTDIGNPIIARRLAEEIVRLNLI